MSVSGIERRKARILSAAEAFVRTMHVPKDGKITLAEWRREQQAAYERLVAAVEPLGGSGSEPNRESQDVTRKEAVDATDS